MLYARLVALPMTRFADASIGDAVYRVMYDTPSITRVCYDVLVLPVVSLFSIGIAIWTMQYSFADVPELIMIAWLAAPLMLLSTLVMTGSDATVAMNGHNLIADKGFSALLTTGQVDFSGLG